MNFEAMTEAECRAYADAEQRPWIPAGKALEDWLAERGYDNCPMEIHPYRFRGMSVTPPNDSGVYLLFGESDELLYVGKAACIYYRLTTHWRDARIPFTRVSWFELPPGANDMLEAYFIGYMDPPMNRKYSPDMKRLADRLAESMKRRRASMAEANQDKR